MSEQLPEVQAGTGSGEVVDEPLIPGFEQQGPDDLPVANAAEIAEVLAEVNAEPIAEAVVNEPEESEYLKGCMDGDEIARYLLTHCAACKKEFQPNNIAIYKYNVFFCRKFCEMIYEGPK